MTLSLPKKDNKRSIGTFNRVVLIVASLILVSFTSFSQEEVIDQSHTGSNDWYTCLVDNQIIGQSFAANKTGILNAIDLDFSINPCPLLTEYSFTVDIIEGNGFSGTVLTTERVTVSIPFTRSMLHIDFVNAPQITTSQIYTIRATPINNQVCDDFLGGPTNVCAIWFMSQIDSYAGGIQYINGAQDNIYDKYFNTYVTETITSTIDETKNAFQVYPNPTNSNLTISFPDNLKDAELRVINILGQTVLKKELNNQLTIDLRIEGNPGLYFVALKTADGKSTLVKVLKE